MSFSIAIASLIMLLVCCTPDREFAPPPKATPVGGASNIQPGTLKINEFMASGSTFSNELESAGSDWLEIYNTTGDTIPMMGGRWFLTDSLANPVLFEMPDTSILPYGFLVVWCDNHDTTITQIHSNFGLSKNGEEIGLTYYTADSTKVDIDNYTFSVQTSGSSMERFPDGTVNWIFSTNPTPQNPNQE